MRKLVIALALTSAVFAGTTVYYARQLSAERERLSLPATPPTPVAASVAPAGPSAPIPATQTAASKPEASMNSKIEFLTNVGVSGGQTMTEADIKKMQAEYSRTLLAQMADPERHEEMLTQFKMMMRNTYPRVDQVIGLTPAEYAKFIEINAQQQIDMQLDSARCMVDPSCQLDDLARQSSDTRSGEIKELLGAERAQKFETYKNTMGEREAVSQLRSRLPDAQRLTDANAELLITALAEERNSIHQEAAQRGGGVNSFTGAGIVFSSADGGTYEERYESARQSSERIRNRAAQFLSAEQMRAFNEMQDETLISLRGALRYKGGMGGYTDSAAAVSVAEPAVNGN